MNTGKRADARSTDTEFAGLPKAVRLFRNGAHNVIVSTFSVVQFDVLEFNYGPFVVELNSVSAGITVQEPGIYEMIGHPTILNGPVNEYYATLDINGAQTEISSHPNTGVNPRWYVQTRKELKALDKIRMTIFSGSANTTMIPGESWIYVEKKGGQY